MELDNWEKEEIKRLMDDVKNPEIRKMWRDIGAKGMISAVGEYTPFEFFALLDYIDFLEDELNSALSGKWNNDG